MICQKQFFERLHQELPFVISRDHIGVYLGGIISPKRLANLDSQGLGPPRFRVGRKIAYRTDDLLAWLRKRTTVLKESEGEDQNG